MSEETKETSKIILESFQLNKNLLEELSTTINEEYVKTVKEEKDEYEKKYIKLEYTLNTKNKQIDTSDFKAILKHWSSKNFEKIVINFQSSKKNITVRCGGYWNLDISISGIDSIWVSGLTKNLEDISNKYKSKNEFFHKSRAYVIYFGIPLLLGLSMLMIISTLTEVSMLNLETDTDTSNTSSYLPAVLIVSIPTYSFPGWASLFHWLFPKIELEDSVKPNVRKAILGGISTVVFSLFTGGILIFLQNLPNQ